MAPFTRMQIEFCLTIQYKLFTLATALAIVHFCHFSIVMNILFLCVEMEKRKRENSYNAIGFSYNTSSSLSHQHPSNHLDGVPYDGVPLDYNLQRLEHPSTSTVDLGSEKYRFVPCAGLVIPSGMQTVSK